MIVEQEASSLIRTLPEKKDLKCEGFGKSFSGIQCRWVLSCDATWKMIDGVYPELKSEQDEYRFKVEIRETELE